MTIVAPPRPDHVLAAERRAERIRTVATTLVEAREKLGRLLSEAQSEKDYEALGYRSWTDYVSALFSDTPLMRLSREERRELVSELADEGMSTRAIAPIVGASPRTVAYDLDSPVQDCTPDAEPRQITGRDGKTYTRPAPEPVTVDHDTGEITQPEPRKRPRRPIHETARTAAMNLREAADRLGIEVHDDRFPAIAEELAPQLRNQLAYVIETCQGYLDELTPNKE